MPDPRTYSRFLARMSIPRLASVLWSERGMALSPERFSFWVKVAIQHSSEPTVLRDVGGALWDYNRRRPGTVPIPRELVNRLLASDDVDCRINGGKLLLIAASDFRELLATAGAMLGSTDSYESTGGLFVLIETLDRELKSPGSYSNVNGDPLKQLLAATDIAKWRPHQLASLSTLQKYIDSLSGRENPG